MIRQLCVASLVALSVAAPAAAQTMPLPTFVKRGTSLMNKGPMALLHKGEINLLMKEMNGASAILKAERQAAEKAGRPAPYCPPKDKKASIGAQQLMGDLRAIPAAQARTMTITDGFRQVMINRFPCR